MSCIALTIIKDIKSKIDMDDDPLPEQFRHVRDSERKVKDDFYKTCANLSSRVLVRMNARMQL